MADGEQPDSIPARESRFASLRRRERGALTASLDAVAAGPKLADVSLYAERWKRPGERVHPHEYPRYPRAAEAFAVPGAR